MENIKDFPQFTPIEAVHEGFFKAYFADNPTEVSEFSFAEMFAWRAVRHTSVAMLDGCVCVLLQKNGRWCFYPPFGRDNRPEAASEMVRYLAYQKGGGYIYGLTEDEAVEFTTHDPELEYYEDMDNADYIYASTDLISLAGRKYDGKRNHLNKFFENCQYTFEPMTQAIIGEVKEFQEKWCKARACDDDMSLHNEGMAVMEVLDNFSALPVTGAAIRIEGAIQAFSVATEVNPEMAVVLFEKANPEFRGIYQAINNLFCRNMLDKYTWINREQDSGSEGLRKAKLSYNPARMVRKYNLKFKSK